MNKFTLFSRVRKKKRKDNGNEFDNSNSCKTLYETRDFQELKIIHVPLYIHAIQWIRI